MPRQNASRRQLLSLGALMFLAPALRLFPAQSAALAGRAAWLTPWAALPGLLLYARFLTALLSLRRAGEDLPALITRTAGRPVLALCALWLLLYVAFVLRSGADRFVGTVYPRASFALFAELMGALALAGALAGLRSLARVGRMLLPLLLGALLLLLAVSLRGVRVDNLLPLGPRELPGLMRGALVPVDLIAGIAAALCFAPRAEGDGRGTLRALALWMLGLCALLSLLALAVTGRFGHELSAELARPFFVLARTLRLFGSVERIEALVVMLWIFPDFLCASLYLRAGVGCVSCLLGLGREDTAASRLGLRSQRPLIWLGAAAAAGLSLVLAPDARSLERWSTAIIPAANLCFCLALLPALCLLARRKEKKESKRGES